VDGIENEADGDSLANQEASLMDEAGDEARSWEELRDGFKEDGLKRTERFKVHFDLILVITLYVMATGVAIFAMCWALHIILPDCLHWLNDKQIERIQNLVTGGLLFGIISEQFKRKTDV
jgi:hypothetical protein